VDVYVNNFIVLTQGDCNDQSAVQRLLFHAIDAVFRHNDTRKAARKDPISVKKLQRGDACWSTVHKILGWLLDTLACTISLPEGVFDKVLFHLRVILRSQNRTSVRKQDNLLGGLRHISPVIPSGMGYFSHLQAALQKRGQQVALKESVHDKLEDWETLVLSLRNQPTHLTEIVPGAPTDLGAKNSSQISLGGTFWGPDAHPFL